MVKDEGTYHSKHSMRHSIVDDVDVYQGKASVLDGYPNNVDQGTGCCFDIMFKMLMQFLDCDQFCIDL